MRPISEGQRYLDFSEPTSLKVVREYRAKYAGIDQLLEAAPELLAVVHKDLRRLSLSRDGRKAKYTTENIFRAVVVHQLEKTSLRETVIRISESPTLQGFIRLGTRPVMDFTFLNRGFKAIRVETWQRLNEILRSHALKEQDLDVSRIRADSTVIETNIHYPSDRSLLWDSYRVLARVLRAVRQEAPELCPHRFHDRKAKKDFAYLSRYIGSRSKSRKQECRQRFRRLIGSVRRLHGIGEPLSKGLVASGNFTLRGLGAELAHFLPLIEQVCTVAERAGLQGESVPARERIFSIFEEHTELIKRGKTCHPVEFGHAVWLAQSPSKFITDYEVMERKIPDPELLARITSRHHAAFQRYPEVVAADMGFRTNAEEMVKIEECIETVAIPDRGANAVAVERRWHHFRAGIEGSISVLKRAFRLSVCLYRGFKSFAAAIGMAVFCHNLRILLPKPAAT